MRSWSVLMIGVLLVCGCGGKSYRYAPVSGRVTLNNQPLAKAHLYFQPMSATLSDNPGLGSIGVTDADGNYTLRVNDTQSGAIVGTHRVMITTVSDADQVFPQADGSAKPPRDKVPMKYKNGEIELTCVVPVEGRTDANFDLKSP